MSRVGAFAVAELTRNSEDIFPVWSRDGKRIAFERESLGGRAYVYVVSADGGRARRVPGVLADAEPLGWGPGGRIVFGNGKGISVVSPDGSGLKQLVLRPPRQSSFSEATWAPDGKHVAFLETELAVPESAATSVDVANYSLPWAEE